MSDDAGQRRALWWAAAIFAALSLTLGVVSEGFLNGDACAHYLVARDAIEQPHLLWAVWARPVCTGLYALPAFVAGRAGVRVLSTFIALGVAWLTYLVARGQKQRAPALAFLFVLGQPLVFLHSFSELTELPFALLMALSLFAYQRRWWWLLALAAGLSPASRPEGFGVVLLAGVALVLHRSWALVLLPLPLLGWSFAGAMTMHSREPWWRWLPANWPYSTNSAYTPGSLFKFVFALPIIGPPAAFIPMMLGWVNTAKAALAQRLGGLWGERPEAHHRRVEMIIAGFPLGVLAVHSLLYWKGKMASNGEIRYMLVAAPMWALLASSGCDWLIARFSLRKVLLAAGVGLLLPLAAPPLWRFIPLTWASDWAEGRDFVAWYQSSPLRAQYPRLMNSHVGITYFLTQHGPAPREEVWLRANVERNRPGTIAVWSSIYGPTNATASAVVTPAQFLDAGWVEQPWPLGEVRRLEDGSPVWRLYLSAQPAAPDGSSFR